MNKNLYCVFNSYPDREYAIVIDSVFNDEFSETLDSASIVITQVEESLRLSSLQVKSEIVYIYDKETNFSKYMLVDNYVEQIINIKDNVYKYIINLMSLTKLLETIQCPNLVITHSLVSGQKKISQYIKQYVEVYSPKVKMKIGDKWEYQPLINIDDELIDNKFNQKCRDLAFTNNTLREVLTTLMIQQQCIPTLDVRTSTGKIYLSWLDLNEKRETFVKSFSINYIQKSMASDSYVNNLVYMNDNVLDDNNSVITESIGFRDTDNATLKQTSNFKLQTTYPIYSIKEAILKIPSKISLTFKSAIVKNKNDTDTTLSLHIQNSMTMWIYDDTTKPLLPNITFTSGILYKYDDNGTFTKVGEVITNQSLTPMKDSILKSYQLLSDSYEYILIATYYTSNDSTIRKGVLYKGRLSYQLYYVYSVDITKNIVERSKRQLLETNYVNMREEETLSGISNYYYGTAYYTIGSNVIQGFSETYTLALLWWNNTYTLLENMVGVAINDKTALLNNKDTLIKEISNGLIDDIEFIDSYYVLNVVKDSDANSITKFLNMFFNITYQPLNTLRLEISKDKDIPFNVSQFDSSSNSITNLEYLGIAGLEKVNRYGNEILAIHQRTTNANDIQPLNSLYEDNYIVFKRTIDYSYGAYVVNYICAKDYILKNYFTSIETKYRAYEYISYGSTTIRKENTHIYARIGYNYYDGDDYIYWGNKANKTSKDLSYMLLSALLPISDNDNALSYKVATTGDNYGLSLYKSDLSVATFNKTIFFNTQLFDSVSYGVWVNYTSEYVDKVGGAPQKWYMNNEDRSFISIAFNTSDFVDTNVIFDEQGMNDYIEHNYSLPLVKQDDINFFDNIMYVVDNNKSEFVNVEGKTFYLDQSEVLNYTLQIDYYTNSDSITFNKNLVDFNTMKVGKLSGKKYLVGYNLLSNIDFNESAYNDLGNYQTMKEITTSNCVYDANSITYKSLQNHRQYKVVYEENGLYYDLIKFNVLQQTTETFVSQTIYITLNDTRSDRVGSYVEVNGNLLLTFNKCNVKTNNLQREIEGV